MTDINKTVLVGRLTKDIEIKYTNSGAAIGNLSIAVNRSRKQDDQWVDEASFFDVKIYGKMAESLRQSICGQIWQADMLRGTKSLLLAEYLTRLQEDFI